jgi:hypothetical protein
MHDCKLLVSEGYDVMLLPIVLRSLGTLCECLDRATTEMDIPNARKKKERNYTASSTYTVSTVFKTLCPNGDPWKDKANRRSKGKNKRQIASLPTPSCP